MASKLSATGMPVDSGFGQIFVTSMPATCVHSSMKRSVRYPEPMQPTVTAAEQTAAKSLFFFIYVSFFAIIIFVV